MSFCTFCDWVTSPGWGRYTGMYSCFEENHDRFWKYCFEPFVRSKRSFWTHAGSNLSFWTQVASSHSFWTLSGSYLSSWTLSGFNLSFYIAGSTLSFWMYVGYNLSFWTHTGLNLSLWAHAGSNLSSLWMWRSFSCTRPQYMNTTKNCIFLFLALIVSLCLALFGFIHSFRSERNWNVSMEHIFSGS